MRRPRAFTCSKLKAEPLPPPTRKPLGYGLTSATTSVQASSPCKCGRCGESPATASSSPTSPSSQSPPFSRIREATAAGGQGFRTPPLAEALGPSNNGSPATAGRPRFRRLPRNAHLPRRSVFNNPPQLPAPPSTSLLAAAGGELEEHGDGRAGGLLALPPPPPPSDQRKRGSDRGEPRGSFAAPTAGKQLAASAAASTPTKSAAAGATAPAASPTTEAGGSTTRAAGTKSTATAAAATPVAVSVDAAGGQKSLTTMYCEAGDSVASFIRPGVTFIKVDSAGVASVCDVSIIQNDGSVNSSSSSSGSSSSNNAAGSRAGMTGFDECKAPATDASGVFSMGSSSSRAAFGRRRRRVGG